MISNSSKSNSAAGLRSSLFVIFSLSFSIKNKQNFKVFISKHLKSIHRKIHKLSKGYKLFDFRYIFLEYSNPASAQEAVKMTNGYKLDKAHTFAVNVFSDYDK